MSASLEAKEYLVEVSAPGATGEVLISGSLEQISYLEQVFELFNKKNPGHSQPHLALKPPKSLHVTLPVTFSFPTPLTGEKVTLSTPTSVPGSISRTLYKEDEPTHPLNRFLLDYLEGRVKSESNDHNSGKLHIHTVVLCTTLNERWELLYLCVYNPPEGMGAYECYFLFHRGMRYILSVDLKDNKVHHWSADLYDKVELEGQIEQEALDNWVNSNNLEGAVDQRLPAIASFVALADKSLDLVQQHLTPRL